MDRPSVRGLIFFWSCQWLWFNWWTVRIFQKTLFQHVLLEKRFQRQNGAILIDKEEEEEDILWHLACWPHAHFLTQADLQSRQRRSHGEDIVLHQSQASHSISWRYLQCKCCPVSMLMWSRWPGNGWIAWPSELTTFFTSREFCRCSTYSQRTSTAWLTTVALLSGPFMDWLLQLSSLWDLPGKTWRDRSG